MYELLARILQIPRSLAAFIEGVRCVGVTLQLLQVDAQRPEVGGIGGRDAQRGLLELHDGKSVFPETKINQTQPAVRPQDFGCLVGCKLFVGKPRGLG